MSGLTTSPSAGGGPISVRFALTQQCRSRSVVATPCVLEVETNRGELRPEPLDEASVSGTIPALQACGRVVLVEDRCIRCPPPSAMTNTNLRLRLEISDPRRVAALLGNDPDRLAVAVGPDDGASCSARPSARCLDDDVSGHDTHPDSEFHRRVQHPSLVCDNSASLAVTGVDRAHWSLPRIASTRDSSTSSSVCNQSARSGS